MLKQLRRKFILINMLLVSLVLLVVLTVQMVTAWRQVTAQSEEALRRAVLWGESGPDRWQVGGAIIGGDSPLMVPVFCVIFNWDGTVSMVLDHGCNVVPSGVRSPDWRRRPGHFEGIGPTVFTGGHGRKPADRLC